MYSENEIEKRLLLGKSINIGFCTLHSLTIDEIEALEDGFDTHDKYLGILCISSEDIAEMLGTEDNEEVIEPFDYIYACCYHNEDAKSETLKALKLFIKEDIKFYTEGFFLIGDVEEERVIHRGNFNFIIDLLKKQNCINKQKELVEAKTEAQRKHLKMLKKMRRKYAKKEDDITSIISSVCAKHPSINLLNVGQLTMYQLIDQFKALIKIDEYFIQIKSLLAGASKDDVKVVHWSSNNQ